MQPVTHTNSSTLVKINIMQPPNQHQNVSLDFGERGEKERGKREMAANGMREDVGKVKQGQGINQKGQLLGRLMNSPEGEGKDGRWEGAAGRRLNPFSSPEIKYTSGSKMEVKVG
jgi:hypothetical protein